MSGNGETGGGVDLLEGEIAEACGTLNVAAGRLVSLIAQVLENESWAGAGIHSAEQWVAWKVGVSLGRARSLVAMARRLPELPECAAALAAGELSEDQVGVIVRHTPAHNDAEAATLARSATVAQLRTWRLRALLPPDEGALVERALAVARQRLFAGDADHGDDPRLVTWADALVAVAEGSLASEAVARPHYDRHLVVLHVGTDNDGQPTGHLHLGPALPDALRRFITCDARGRVQLDAKATPLSVGRSARIVADRTRLAIEERDGACRVPSCERTRWLHIHHLRHWVDGGATDTDNLLALCSRHHRQHHRGELGIAGNADDPDGVVFTDARGRPLARCGTPRPPTGPLPTGTWVHPTGERLDLHWVDFMPPPGTPAPARLVAPVPADPRPPAPPRRRCTPPTTRRASTSTIPSSTAGATTSCSPTEPPYRAEGPSGSMSLCSLRTTCRSSSTASSVTSSTGSSGFSASCSTRPFASVSRSPVTRPTVSVILPILSPMISTPVLGAGEGGRPQQ